MLWIEFLSTFSDIALRCMPQNFVDDNSTLVQIMSCCLMAPSHYLSQCWLRSMWLYGVTGPQWIVRTAISSFVMILINISMIYILLSILNKLFSDDFQPVSDNPLSSTKPLYHYVESMMIYFQLNPMEPTAVKSESKYKTFISRTCKWNCKMIAMVGQCV